MTIRKITTLILCVFLSMLVFIGNVQGAEVKTINSKKVESPPTIDGISDDAVWDFAKAVTTSNGVQLKSVHVGDNIYFLAIWTDSTQSDTKKEWIFDDPEWDPESSDEDSLAFNWNIDNSIANFNSDGCTVLCHPPQMRTNSASEEADVWFWRAARSNPSGWVDDRWMDSSGRHEDNRNSGGLFDNKQTLDFADDPQDHDDVPLYWEPDAVGEDAKAITQSEIDSGETRTITEIYTDGTMKDEDGTTVPTGTKIPFYYQSKPKGSRGDITAKGIWVNGKWTLEFSRRMNTGNSHDIQFNDLEKSYYFGIAVHDKSEGSSHNTDSAVYKLTFSETDAEPSGETDALSENLPFILSLILLLIIVLVIFLILRSKKK
jgi:hypothetical protein